MMTSHLIHLQLMKQQNVLRKQNTIARLNLCRFFQHTLNKTLNKVTLSNPEQLNHCVHASHWIVQHLTLFAYFSSGNSRCTVGLPLGSNREH